MRFFLALEIPSENRLQIQAIQQKLHTLIPQVRLTDPDKLHLTLAFVGEQPDSLQEDLTQVLHQAALDIPSFEVTPAYIDGFPNIHHPQVLWIGVKGDIDKLLLIHERIKDGLSELNLVTDERRFVPHIAIAKVSHFKVNQELEVSLQKLMAEPFNPIQISSLKLFQSIPEEGLHKHNTLAEVKLS